MRNRRVGIFSIGMDIIRRDERLARQALGGVLVLRAEAMAFDDTIEYCGLCDAFEEVPEHLQPNRYLAICVIENGVSRFMGWEKVG